MKIKIISPLRVKGRTTGLVNYAYFSDDGVQVSATFQARRSYVERLIMGVE